MSYPNLDRLAKADPDTLTSRQIQVHVIHQDHKGAARDQSIKDARMAAAVPALLAHIDELYGEAAATERKFQLLAEEIAAARTESVEAFIERRLNHRDHDATQTQIDDWRIEARIAWNNAHPVLAGLLKTRGVR